MIFCAGLLLRVKTENKQNESAKLMNDAELGVLLDKMTEQSGKIAKEQSDRFDAVVAANKVLQDIIDAGGVITPATEAKAATLQAALDSLDASIPDAPLE